ncbi:MAG TPA: hypothetical protein VGB02_04645 [Pyrinomonadaceae bacterium]|jgi:hypothetical protein
MGEPTEFGIAAQMAQGIATSVLGGQAAKLTDPLFALLGINQNGAAATNYDAYFQQVESGLTQIEGTLDKVVAKLQVLASGISAISNQLTSISSQISDSDLQTLLIGYESASNVINTNYAAYSDALSDMGSNSTFKQGTDQLFDLFQINNADAVSKAILDIGDLLTSEGEHQGIISYQPNEITRVYAVMASDPKQTTTLSYPGTEDDGGEEGPRPKDLSNWYYAFPDGSLILNALPVVLENTFDQTIIPLLKAALGVQLKGLNFLCSAWGSSGNNEGLALVTAKIGKVLQQIQGLHSLINLDDIASSMLKLHGTQLTDSQINTNWSQPNSDTKLGSPFDETWIFWNGGPNSMFGDITVLGAALVKEPWLWGSVPAYFVGNSGALNASVSPPITIMSPSSAGVTLPPGFMSFIASLPVSVGPAVPQS